MHVAYIHQHFSTPKGETGTRSYEMSRRLIAAGHRVTMICGDYEPARLDAGSNARVAELDVDGIRVLRVREPYANRMGFSRRLLAFGRFARVAEKLVASLDADLVFATSTPLTVGIPGMKGAKRLGVPFVFEVRDLWPEGPIAVGVLKNPFLIWYAKRLERRIYQAAAHIIALSPGMKEGVSATGYPQDRVTMIPNGCDLDVFRPSDEPLADDRLGDPADLRLIFTGAHGLANGLDAVLDAAAELKRRGIRGVRFVFLGNGGEKPRLVQRSRDEGLSDLTAWLDPVSKLELAQILPRMDVGLMILRNIPMFYYGTSPNKFFDYIAAGLPVLNNYPGWVADMLAEHRCGVAVQPENPVVFADAVLDLYERRGELREMGLRGRHLAESQFARDTLAARFVETLERAHQASRTAVRV